MREGDKWKVVFRTNRGLFEPLVMFFGLTNFPATFQTMMNQLFRDLINQGHVVIYMDDIMIFTTDLDQHQKVVSKVLQILRENKLYLKYTKCEFKQSETKYLGLIIGHQTVKMDSAKVKGVTSWPVPTTRKQVRSFLGFLNFYQQFIKDFTQKAKPLNAAISEKIDFVWTNECQQAFESLKEAITTALALTMPTPDDPPRVETDGSGIGLGAVLTQKQNDRWHPIAFILKSLSKAECNYHAADLEVDAIIFALQEWRHYLLGAKHPFEILTDHQNLLYFKRPQDPSRRQACWQQLLQEYHFTITGQEKLTPLILCPGGQTLRRG